MRVQDGCVGIENGPPPAHLAVAFRVAGRRTEGVSRMNHPSGSAPILPDPPSDGRNWPEAVTVIVAMLIANGQTVTGIRTVLQILLGLLALHVVWGRVRR
jgi:hypothetical protein